MEGNNEAKEENKEQKQETVESEDLAIETPEKKVKIMAPMSAAEKKAALIPGSLVLDGAEEHAAKPETPRCVASLLHAKKRRRKIPKEAFENLQSAFDEVVMAEEKFEIRQKEFLVWMLDGDDEFDLSGLESRKKVMRKIDD